MLRKMTAFVALTIFAATCSASTIIPGTPNMLRETVVLGDVASYNAQDDPDNVVVTAAVAGGYTLGEIVVRGTVTDNGQAGNWISDADIFATFGTNTIDLNGSTINGNNGGVGDAVSNAQAASFDPMDPAATFQFYEQFDEGPGGPPTGTADADNLWTAAELDLYDDSGTPDMVVNGTGAAFELGTIAGDTTMTFASGTNVAGGWDEWTFTIPADAQFSGSFLNIQTTDPGTDVIDTELGIFDSAGNFIATDDDGNAGAYSQLTFGDDPLATAIGDFNAVSGADGATLAPGTYTVVVGGFNTTFGATLGDTIISPTSSAGDYDLKITYLVPEPSSALMLLLGFVGFLRIRKS